MNSSKKVDLFFHYVIVLFLFTMYFSANVKSQELEVETILANEKFIENFNFEYNGVKDFKLSDMISELGDVIEESLVSGSHFKTVTIRPKIQIFQDALFNLIKDRLHTSGTQDSLKKSTKIELQHSMKIIVVKSVINIYESQNISINNYYLGLISGVVLRILEKVTLQQILSRKSFDELGK